MAISSPFVSACSRRQLARRRGGRLRRWLHGMTTPALITTAVALAGMAAFLAGRGGL